MIPQRRLAVYPNYRDCFLACRLRRHRWRCRRGAVVSRLGEEWRRLSELGISVRSVEERGVKDALRGDASLR